MLAEKDKALINKWIDIIKDVLLYIFKKWHLLLLAILLGGAFGWFKVYDIKPTYSASLTFVLSTEGGRVGGGGISALASQLGLDAGNGSTESVFSGDNIIELFKTRKLIERTLLHKVEGQQINLLEWIIKKQNGTVNQALKPFPTNPDDLTATQAGLLRRYTGLVSRSFTVLKKDKKLSYYVASSTSTIDELPYHIVHYIVDVTSQFFIETKTKVARQNLALLEKEADSLGRVLGITIETTAAATDRTFNMNSGLLVQRAGVQFSQARLNALSAAYTEVMRNLELAKISVQKETPLFQVIDEPLLPLAAFKVDIVRPIIIWSLIALFLAVALIIAFKFWKDFKLQFKQTSTNA